MAMGELGWWRFNKDGEFAVKAKERTHGHFPNLLDCRPIYVRAPVEIVDRARRGRGYGSLESMAPDAVVLLAITRRNGLLKRLACGERRTRPGLRQLPSGTWMVREHC